MSHVYQPLLIRTLVEAGGVATVRQLAQAFLVQDESQLQYYENRIKQMPVPVLTKRGVVAREKELVRLTVSKLDLRERAAIVGLCEKRLQEYIESRGLKIWDYRLMDSDPVPGSTYYNVMKAARGRCALCGATRDDRPLHVDHIIPRTRWDARLGDVNDIANLQVLCSKCNVTKLNRDDTDFRTLPAETDPNCPFCVESQRKANIADVGSVVTFPDGYPVTRGHTLVVPKRHVADYFDLSDREQDDARQAIRVLRNRLLKTDDTITGFNVGVNVGRSAGQTVMHCHFHLIPRRDSDMADPQGGVRGVIPDRRKYH